MNEFHTYNSPTKQIYYTFRLIKLLLPDKLLNYPIINSFHSIHSFQKIVVIIPLREDAKRKRRIIYTEYHPNHCYLHFTRSYLDHHLHLLLPFPFFFFFPPKRSRLHLQFTRRFGGAGRLIIDDTNSGWK